MLTQVNRRDLPSVDGRRAHREPFVAKDVREFLRSGMECAELTYEGKTRDCVRNCAAKYVRTRKLGDQVRVIQRGGRVFLVRLPGVIR